MFAHEWFAQSSLALPNRDTLEEGCSWSMRPRSYWLTSHRAYSF